jgi:hypothetical protein
MSLLKREAEIEFECRVIAERTKCKLLKIQGVKGWPDRILLMPTGNVAFLEFKTPSGQLSPLQVHHMTMLRSMGFPIFVPKSKEQFQQILSLMLSLPATGSLDHIKYVASTGSYDLKQLSSYLLD